MRTKTFLDGAGRNKVYYEITETDFEEIWQRENQDENEPIRLNGKYV